MKQFKTLDEIYATVPEMDCKGLCQAYCGVIPLRPVEVQRLNDRGIKVLSHDENNSCTCLTADGKCSIYENRPFICRVWGTRKDLSCPHGCKPKTNWMRDRILNRAMKALVEMSKEDVVKIYQNGDYPSQSLR